MNQTIRLDAKKRESSFCEENIYPLRRGERNNVMLTVQVRANGQPYDLAGKTASLVATTAAGKLVGPCPMEVAEAGIARIMLPSALYSAVGAFSGYVEIREGETLVDTTDSFGGKVIECADLDSEQAAEFTPLLGELQNAVAAEAKRVEAEKARVQAETERATGFAEAKQASQAATEAANDAAADARSAAGSASAAAESANTAAGKATNAAVKAESDVRAFVNAAVTSVGDAIAAAREDVDAAVKRSDAATAKAEAAVETADSANTAATKAVTDAKAAIAEVKATEAKLYPVAENILVGSETGTVAHVEDAFAGAALREITVEGACRQDGTPSPDNPVPIEVVENPVVRVTGRNLLDIHEGMPESDCNKDFDKATKRIIKPGTCVIGLTSNNYLADNILNVQIGNGAVSFHSEEGGYGIGFGVSLVPGVTYKFGAQGNAEFKFAFYSADGTWLSQCITNTPTVPINAVYSVLVITTKGGSSDVALRDIYGAVTQITYAPYVGTSQAFTLPAEHPYLAKLPDGTADEIVVDREGNVELVARVLQIKVPDGGFTWTIQEQPRGFSLGYIGSISGLSDIKKRLNASALMGDKLSGKSTWENNPCFGFSEVLWVVPRTNQNDITSEDVAAVANGMVFYAPLATSVTYQLGKIEMPKAQDSIVNVWTDAEVTPRTGIEYTRDVNIVVANLEAAIASITQG